MVKRKEDTADDVVDNANTLADKQDEALTQYQANNEAISAALRDTGALTVISDETISEALDALREIGVSMTRYTPTKELAAKDLTLFMLDAVTITIKDSDVVPGEPARMKPVHVFQLETADGQVFYTMLGANAIRDRFPRGFLAMARISQRLRIGPIKLGQIMTSGGAKFGNAAWTFDPQPGYGVVRWPVGMQEPERRVQTASA